MTQGNRHQDARRHTATVEIHLLGGFAVVVDGVPASRRGWGRRSAASLVKILALAPRRQLHREEVMDLLWPDEDVGRAAPRLHKAAHYARQAAGSADAVVLRDDVVTLFPHAEVLVDVACFEGLARAAVASEDPGAAQEAVRAYRGDLLPADRYEDWAADRRELLRLRHLEVLRIAGAWRELAELDPTDEHALAEVMRGLLRAGDPAAAVGQYRHAEAVLERELAVAPGEQVQNLLRDALAQLGGSGSAISVMLPHRWPAHGDVDAGSLLAELVDLTRRERDLLTRLLAVYGGATTSMVVGGGR